MLEQSEGSTGADDSNFGPKQGGGDSEKTLLKLPNKKSKQTYAGFNDRGAGWITVRQQVLYFALFCRICHKCPKQILITV